MPITVRFARSTATVLMIGSLDLLPTFVSIQIESGLDHASMIKVREFIPDGEKDRFAELQNKIYRVVTDAFDGTMVDCNFQVVTTGIRAGVEATQSYMVLREV